MGSGFFCVFEGLDGSGKSTLLERVALALEERVEIQARFTAVVRQKEPTDSPEGRAIRQRLQSSDDADSDAWLEYFQNDRAGNVQANIRPGVAAGKLILQDRYFYSTAAYQGVDDDRPTGSHSSAGPSPEEIVADSLGRGFPEPDLLLYLAIDPAVALERIDRSRAGREVFERQDRLQKIAARYERILPAATVRLDANRDPEALTADAVAAILERV